LLEEKRLCELDRSFLEGDDEFTLFLCGLHIRAFGLWIGAFGLKLLTNIRHLALDERAATKEKTDVIVEIFDQIFNDGDALVVVGKGEQRVWIRRSGEKRRKLSTKAHEDREEKRREDREEKRREEKIEKRRTRREEKIEKRR